jgi:hypothetical protein
MTSLTGSSFEGVRESDGDRLRRLLEVKSLDERVVREVGGRKGPKKAKQVDSVGFRDKEHWRHSYYVAGLLEIVEDNIDCYLARQMLKLPELACRVSSVLKCKRKRDSSPKARACISS